MMFVIFQVTCDKPQFNTENESLIGVFKIFLAVWLEIHTYTCNGINQILPFGQFNNIQYIGNSSFPLKLMNMFIIISL